jgi:hypothetical protein
MLLVLAREAPQDRFCLLGAESLCRGVLDHLVVLLADGRPDRGRAHLGGGAVAPSSLVKRSATRVRQAAAMTPTRRQMRSLLRSCGFLGEAAYSVLELAEQARPHIQAGDGSSALAILEAVTDEFANGWTDLDDSDGDTWCETEGQRTFRFVATTGLT